MDSNFLEIVLDECGSVTKDNEIFVYNPLQLCRNLITEGYSMDQLVHFFSENVYRMVLDKKFFLSGATISDCILRAISAFFYLKTTVLMNLLRL